MPPDIDRLAQEQRLLAHFREIDPSVDLILDRTEEEVNWLRAKPKKGAAT